MIRRAPAESALTRILVFGWPVEERESAPWIRLDADLCVELESLRSFSIVQSRRVKLSYVIALWA
jgi:hypothetical protein